MPYGAINPRLLFVADSVAAVADLSMLSRGQEYHLVPGTQLALDCEFYMDSFKDFDNPIIWTKTQLHERAMVTIVGMVLEPFESTRRFNVALIREPPRYRLILKIKGIEPLKSTNFSVLNHTTTRNSPHPPLHSSLCPYDRLTL